MYDILVVEDDRNTNQVICEFLKAAGYAVTAVYNGESAISCFCEKHYDLVVLDIMLPKKNGMEVLKELRSLSNVPVIMLTALADEYTQVKSFDLQADEYVTKPFSAIVLTKRVSAMLRRNHPMDKKVVTFENITVDFSAYTVAKDGIPLSLTTKEFEILKVLMEHQGQIGRAHV